MRMKKMISWNVNGLRACMKKGFQEYFEAADADIFCLQETKLQEGQIDLELPGYHQYWNYAVKKGYSGTAVFTKKEPLSVTYGIGIEEHDMEGRVITAEFPEYFVVTVYTPNSQDELKRLAYRMEWEDAFLSYLKGLEQEKPVIFCGDLNVAATEIDLKNPKRNVGNPGFSPEERAKFQELLHAGFTDTFRALHPDANITPVDYDPSATRVNQENRIKLMLAVAREKLDQPGEVQPVTAEQLAGGAPQVETVVR